MLEIFSNEETAISPDRLGRTIPNYAKTYDFPGEYINDEQKWWSECPVSGIKVGVRPRPDLDEGPLDNPKYDKRDIFGALRRADALKIYELAYFSNGDVIDMGTAFGLSCSISAQALEKAGGNGCIDTVDLNSTHQEFAKKAISGLPGNQRVSYHLMDGTTFLKQYRDEKRLAGFVFIDHAHTYNAVFEAAQLMDEVVAPGGFVLFHDYNDWRNSDKNDPVYADLWAKVPPERLEEFAAFGAYSAAHEGLSDAFEFHGVFGCTGLFRKNTK
ncbi:MAG: class I SAM-dependent methyltransferase [Sneathiella sp.]|nr:class I SAM-dependent methyltransferase [Sneathiella sp.]